MDITAMPKVPNFEQPATLPQKKLIPSQRTSPPKPIGGKDAHIQGCEGAGNNCQPVFLPAGNTPPALVVTCWTEHLPIISIEARIWLCTFI